MTKLKFSEFLHFRQKFIKDSNSGEVEYSVDQLISKINNTKFEALGLPEFTSGNKIHESLQVFTDEVKTLNELLDKMYDDYEREALSNNQKHYPETLKKVEPYYIRKHQIKPTTELTEYITRKIEIRSNWQFPVLEMQPSDATWALKLIAGAPLYILSTDHHSLLNTKKQFNEIYQKRLCLYYNTCKDLEQIKFCPIANEDYDTTDAIINGYKSKSHIGLPSKQFGYILNYNCFNYMSVEVIDRYIKLTSELLRPGGVALMGYSNCDHVEACVFYENGYWAYNNKRLMTKMIHDNGLEVLSSDDIYPYYSFIEVKAPNKLISIRTHPAIVENLILN